MSYVIKIWFFTILISPLLIALILGILINNSSYESILKSYEIIFVMMIIGLLTSIPAMIVFYLIHHFTKQKLDVNQEKILLSIYSFLSVWITFYLVNNGFITRWSEQTIWVLIYSLTIVLGVWIFKIPKKIMIV